MHSTTRPGAVDRHPPHDYLRAQRIHTHTQQQQQQQQQELMFCKPHLVSKHIVLSYFYFLYFIAVFGSWHNLECKLDIRSSGPRKYSETDGTPEFKNDFRKHVVINGLILPGG